MARPFAIELGEYYHIYNRGFEKSVIFGDHKDRDRFLKILYLCNDVRAVNLRDLPRGLTFGNGDFENLRGKSIVDICAYCLMGNHFHLIIRETSPGGISMFMQKLATSYTMYFNKKYERSGSLMQGTFKARHLYDDAYLKYAFSYVHLNPVEHIDPLWKDHGVNDLKKVKTYLDSYHYFSLPDYLDLERPQEIILNRKALPKYFRTSGDLLKEMNFWLTFKLFTKV